MIWLNWIISPIGRWVSGVGGAIAFLFVAYWKARSDGKEALRREQADEANRRLRNAIEADARGRERIARGELLKDDGFRRD
jgi:hypothetical protein